MVLLRESNEITRFWLYPKMQIEKSERSKRGIVVSRENDTCGHSFIFMVIHLGKIFIFWGIFFSAVLHLRNLQIATFESLFFHLLFIYQIQ